MAKIQLYRDVVKLLPKTRTIDDWAKHYKIPLRNLMPYYDDDKELIDLVYDVDRDASNVVLTEKGKELAAQADQIQMPVEINSNAYRIQHGHLSRYDFYQMFNETETILSTFEWVAKTGVSYQTLLRWIKQSGGALMIIKGAPGRPSQVVNSRVVTTKVI